jgi:integrase
MSRVLRNTLLENRTARARLKPRAKPYKAKIQPGLDVGYRPAKKGAGSWLAILYLGQQRYHFASIGTADDHADADGLTIFSWGMAQEEARKIAAKRANEAAGVVSGKGPLTVAHVLETYLSWLKNHGKSVQSARYCADALIIPELGEIEAAKLTAARIRAWHESLAKTPRRLRTSEGEEQRYQATTNDEDRVRARKSTANRVLVILRAALNRAWREGLIPSDDAWRRVRAFSETDAARVRYLSIAECVRLVNSADADFRPMIRAALETGARFSELARLMVADFNPDSATLAIRKSKSGKSRHVVLTDQGAAFFRTSCAGRPPDEPMFRRADGEQWQGGMQARRMTQACARARISPPVGIHAMRHTYCSHSIMNGAPLLVVARNLGHRDTRMVELHYGHLAEGYIATAIRAAAPRFDGVETSNIHAIA